MAQGVRAHLRRDADRRDRSLTGPRRPQPAGAAAHHTRRLTLPATRSLLGCAPTVGRMRSERAPDVGSGRGVRLVPGGLRIKDEIVPLIAGSVHYWRLDPRDWRACLTATRDLGVRLIDTYVPWGVHEIAPGELELGRGDPQRDVGAFLRLARELGPLRDRAPGPAHQRGAHVLRHPRARRLGPELPGAHAAAPPGDAADGAVRVPVPSYASEAFLDEATRYFRLARARRSRRSSTRTGPIVLLQVDNEGALYFRDGAYDQDYHPDAIALYRAFLREKYKTIDALPQAAYPMRADRARALTRGEADRVATGARFATIAPAHPLRREDAGGDRAHLDWAEFHEHLLARRSSASARRSPPPASTGLPTTHNFPLGQEATPLNAARVGRSVDLVGLDYYHSASRREPHDHRAPHERARRAQRGPRAAGVRVRDRRGLPALLPAARRARQRLHRARGARVRPARLQHLHGGRARSLDRRADRIATAARAPSRPSGASSQGARDDVASTRSRGGRPVRILTPRSERRLARVMHAFGPITGAFFSVIGAGARESVSEDDLGLGYPIAIEADAFVRAFEMALEARGVPFAHIGGEDREVSLDGARWIVARPPAG